MSPLRQLARTASLVLLLTLAAGSAHAASDYYLALEGVNGESTKMTAAGFEVQPFGGTPTAALLVPAVQKVRGFAGTGLAQLACAGTVIPRMVVDVATGGGAPDMRYELQDVVLTSYSSGGSSAGDRPTEQVSLNFTKITFVQLETGERLEFDCASGRCACAP